MATEELIVLLDAKTQKLDAKLRATEQRLDELDGTVKKTDISFKKMAGGAVKLGAAALALSAAITAVVIASAKGRRELEILATQAKTTTSDFQALSFATSQYGIDAEKIADASKDIADRIGEFAAAGTGVFQDYADTMKLGKDAARDAAREFEGLSSQEILGRMVSRMEDAGVSGDKMLFVMESLANDASKLIPLFSENSKELLILKGRFNDVNDSLQITNTQAEGLKAVATTFDLLQSSSGNAATAISATLAPVMDDFFNDIIEVVPDATQAIIDFINSFLDAENISSSKGVRQQIKDSEEMITTLEKRIEKEKEAASSNNQFSGIAKITGEAALQVEKERLRTLNERLVALSEEERLEDAKRAKGGQIGGEGGSGVALDNTTVDEDEKIQAIEDRFKLEEILLAEKLVRELELIGDNYLLQGELRNEFDDKVAALQKKRDKAQEKIDKIEEKREKKRYTKKLDQAAGFVAAASIINSALNDDNKAVAAGLIVADTAVAVMASLKISPYDYANVAVLVATGIAQLASLSSSSPSGGGGGGSSPSTPTTQQDFNPNADLTSLELSDVDELGGSRTIIEFSTSSGDDLLDVIAAQLNKGQQEGRFT